MPSVDAASSLEQVPVISALRERGQPRTAWYWLARAALLVSALALRLWHLEQNGFGIDYYSAAVKSMSQGWHNFFFNAFDPAGFLSVDKPPVALWIQVASVKLFGFHPLSLLLPQALEGVAALWLLYHLVRRRFGELAGLLAGAFLALTPVSVAIDRSNNTDSCLVLVLLVAAWALTRSIEGGGVRWLLAAMALVGLGFNVKMLAAVVVVPIFALVYALGQRSSWRRGALELALGAVVLLVVSASWVVAYDLTPPSRRPFAGSTTSNSMIELAVGHNGLERFVRRARGPAAVPPPGPTAQTAGGPAAPDGGAAGAGRPSGAQRGRMGIDRVPAGVWRLADPRLAGQIGWLLPLALMAPFFGVPWRGLRVPLSAQQLGIVLWSGWALTYAVVYSAAAGIFHAYYLATMAPALAALAGIGIAALWRRYTERGYAGLLLPAAIALTAQWQTHIQSGAPGWERLSLLALSATRVAILVLLVLSLPLGAWMTGRKFGAAALAVAVAALLVTPTAWALSSVLVRGTVMPSADLSRLAPDDADAAARGRFGAQRPVDTRKLVQFLTANRHGERFLFASSTTRVAAPVIIETGHAAMAVGGFMGIDPILTPERLAALAAAGEVRFVLLGDPWGLRRRFGLEAGGRPIDEWVRANATPVDPALWRSSDPPPAADAATPRAADAGAPRAGGRGRAAMQLYDLRPELGLAGAPGP